MASLATTTQNNNPLVQLNALADEKDKKINELFERLVYDTNSLEEDLPVNKKNEIVTNVTYLIVRLRFILSDEMRRIDYSLSKIDIDNSIPQSTKVFFTKRKTYIGSLIGKLNEIREDLSLVEKSFYYNYKY